MQRKNSEISESTNEQYQKFKEAARELETDQSEENFDRMVKKIAKAKPEEKGKREPQDS